MKTKQGLKIEQSIIIASDLSTIWDVLTNPLKIKIYLFGSETKTTWIAGSPVTFAREYQGTQYLDKGIVLEVIPEKILKFTYWSSQEGYKDSPENYSIITYTLNKENGKIKFTYCRENIPTEFEFINQGKFLPILLETIKKMAEHKT